MISKQILRYKFCSLQNLSNIFKLLDSKVETEEIRTWEMSQQLGELATLAENPGSVLKTVYKSSSSGSESLFPSLLTLICM